jgi:beta-N-acetylhexosaminidase
MALALIAGIAWLVASLQGGPDSWTTRKLGEAAATHHRKTRAAGRGESAPPPVPLRRLIGQRLMVGFHGLTPPHDILRRAQRGQIGGVILYDTNVSSPAQVRALTARLQHAARRGRNPPLLIAADQEGGSIRRFFNAPPTRSAAEIGATEGTAGAAREAAATGRYLHSVGVNLDLAPVADLGLPGGFIAAQARSFGSEPHAVGRFAAAFVHGLHHGGVRATAKHFPGLGNVPVSTDTQMASVSLTRAAFDRGLLPYRTLIRGGVDVVMMSMAIYPTVDRGGMPASLTPSMYELLRGSLGFRGLTITDSLAAPTGLPPATVAVRAAHAGADVLLYPDSGRAAYAALTHAARRGRLSRAGLVTAYERIVAAKGGASTAPGRPH